MNLIIHSLALCALLLVHVPIVTGYYYGVTNVWKWFGISNWMTVAPTENATFVSTVPRMVETVSTVSNQRRKGKSFNEIPSFKDNRITEALIKVVGSIKARESEKAIYIDKETLALANQLPLGHDATSLPIAEYAETTTINPGITLNNNDQEAKMLSTETIKSRHSTVLENSKLLGIFTTLSSKAEQNEDLITTVVSPVEAATGTILSADYASTLIYEKETTKVKGVSANSVSLNAPTTSSPFREFIYGYPNERLRVSTSPDYLTADLSTPMTNIEETTDHSITLDERQRFPKLSDISTESSAVSSKIVPIETIPNATNVVTAQSTDISSSITTTRANNINNAVDADINLSPEIEQITTVKDNLAKSENDYVKEEVTTDNPTKLFIKELIAIKGRLVKANTASSAVASEQSSSGSALTTPSSISSDEMQTSTSVEVNTRSFISQNGPYFLRFTTTPVPVITEPPFERENRMLPFAFYNNQAVSKPVDEGHFVSSFQDFYSDTTIFKGMMSKYVSENKKMTDNVEMNSYWFDNNKVNH